MATLDKNLPHLTSAVDVETMLKTVGSFNWAQPRQAVTAGTIERITHELNSKDPVSATLYNSTNTYVDYHIPKHFHTLEAIDLEVQLSNSNTSAFNFGAAPNFLHSRMEVRISDKIKDTVTDLEQFIDTTVYHDEKHLERHEPRTGVDPTTYGADTTYASVPGEGSRSWRLPVANLLSRCGIAPATISDQIVLRFYSQNISNLRSTAEGGPASAITCTSHKLWVTELHGSDAKLQRKASQPLDYRYLGYQYEDSNVALTNGSTATYITNNFSNRDLASHVWVAIRNSTLTAENLVQFLDNASSIWFENQSGQNMHNGVQSSNTRLLYDEYPRKFENRLSQTSNKALYLTMCPSEAPVDDHERGMVNGARRLAENMKLKIAASATATRNVHIIARVHRHVRVAQGMLTIY